MTGENGTKFQDHKCCTALSPKQPLYPDNTGPSVALTVIVIMISPLTLTINRRKLGEEGVQKNGEKIVKERILQLSVTLSLSAENDPL